MDKPGYIQPFDKSIVPWERGVRAGGVMNKEAMKNNLLDFKAVMDENKVPFILMAGTLLGAVREHDFISYDSDADIACLNGLGVKHHWKLKKIKEDLTKKGFRVVGSDVCYLHADFFIRDAEKIDMFWFTYVDDEWLTGDTLRFPSHYFNKLDKIDFLGAQFTIPSNVEDFLELSYGKKWRVPNPRAAHLNTNPKEVKKRK